LHLRSRARSPLALVVLLAGAGCTDLGVADLASTAQAIVGGSVESGFSGAALVVFNSQTDHAICSGVLVDSRHVVTMGFCLYQGVTSIQVNFTGDSGTMIHQDSATSIGLSPDYNGGTPVDVAVLRLASAVPGTVTPLALHDGTITNSLVGQQVRIVGFGTSDVNNDNSGTKRSALVNITAVETDVFSWNGTSANGCAGDGGGPALLDVGGGQMAVIGLDAHGDMACTDYGTVLRWDVIRSFVNDAIAGRVDGGTSADASSGHDANTGGHDAATSSRARNGSIERTE